MIPSRINRTIALWRSELSAVEPYYAVKCNPSPVFLNYLYDKGIHFDCASERELLEIKSLARIDVSKRIVYANPCKSGRDIAAAARIGSPVTVIDSMEEVEKLAIHGYTGGALIRLAVDDKGSDMPFSSKFGAPLSLVEKIAGFAARRGISLYGFSFHVGSGCKDGSAYEKAIKQSVSMLPVLHDAKHERANIVDIGGGFLADEEDFRMKALCIRSAIHDTDPAIKYIAEPGRFIATDAFDFFVEVIGKKPGKGHGEWRYTIDDSIYGQFSNILFDQAKPVWSRVRHPNETGPRKYIKGTLFGRTCDSLDVIAKSDSMEELQVGDWLRFPKMGAYTRATASEFNGFPTPEIFSIEPHLSALYDDEGSSVQGLEPRYVRYPSAISVKTLLT
jgi:ornithine decarboxylase